MIRFEAEVSSLEGRLTFVLVEGDLTNDLQAARRDFATFSSGIALDIVGMSEEAMADILARC